VKALIATAFVPCCVTPVWTVETADGGARILTDGERSVLVNEAQEAGLASAATKAEFQDLLRQIMQTDELPFDDVDLHGIRDAVAGVVSQPPPSVARIALSRGSGDRS